MPLTIGPSRALLTAKSGGITTVNPTVQSFSSGTNGLVGTTSFSVPAPSGIVAGNLLLAIGASGTETWTPPSGFTLYGTKAASGSSPQLSVFTKTATGSEPGSYTWQTNGGAADATNIAMLNISGTPNPSINGAITFSAYTSTAAVSIGGGSAIPSVLNCLPIAINAINQINLSTAGNPTSLTGGWTGLANSWSIDAGSPGTVANDNGFNALYTANGPLTVNTSSVITAGWTWGGGFSNFAGTSLMLFIAP